MKKILPLKSQCIRVLLLSLPVLFIYCSSNGQAGYTLKFGNSYVNLSKKQVGGTVEPGDTLEIRTTLYVRSTYNGTGRIYSVRYVDNIPSKTDTIAGDSLRLITNEGVTFRNYSLANDGDAGTYLNTPPAGEYQVKINMGGFSFAPDPTAPANNSAGDITGSSDIRANVNKPKVASGTLLTTSFRVKVTGSVGDTIVLGAGQILYKKIAGAGNPDTVVNAIQYQILISNNSTVCGDAVGTNFADEFGGTFGTGPTLNRPTGPTFPIPSYTYVPNVSSAVGVSDGLYAIVNNTSPRASISVNSRMQPNCTTAPAVPITDSCNNRMFSGFWFIDGDHSGTNTAAGNPPVPAGTDGGYMLMVNADVTPSEAYRQTITGLCPNTNYEFSAWVKNVCPNCAIDSNATSTYKPGVLPNLTFVVDDIDRYSTGQLDTLGWLKKGFLFRTGVSQTSITISIRNNAPGGGGNDWVIDDINLATCTPQLNLIPNGNSMVCFGNSVDMNCTVRSYFDNYVNWEWEQSTDGGSTWTTTGVTGSGTPTLVAGAYEYVATYPTFIADSSVHNKMFRIKVASTGANLATSNCSFAASNTLLVLVNSCSELLKTKMLSFDGRLVNNFATLRWLSDNEQSNTIYEIERSEDQVHFTKIGQVYGKAPAGFGSSYTFIDNNAVTNNAYYRLKVREGSSFHFSKIVYLNKNLSFDIKSLVNPFRNTLTFDVIIPEGGTLEIFMLDSYGRLVKKYTQAAETGLKNIILNNLNGISQGTYTLRVQLGDRIINKRVVKVNN